MPTSAAVQPPPWCLFRSDSRPFAVALEAVAEVVQADRLIRLAHCPPQILGLCTVRRDIVPVLSLNPGASGVEPETSVVVLVLRSDQGMWGIRIDREGTAVSDGVLNASAQGEPASGGAEVVGSVQRGDLAHAVINPDRTWRNVRALVEAWYQR
ncbi:chemotaxis protein CheW [Singulisphaera acidiphila]|uniref:Chemotaxis signal transduction protein n=1 Tax=Singulisphaera acidiphila (strain ATCC BAA-1392 / DSM 18658 / VKM B-2454 / MOB10) TaxID=886293 RepID=L0DEK6_SINAD|nr:chemotaxis protein CheW [Singulisphaera acidiphila]AGA27692.1 chemotaxis signal transduction protein [Singulisphaera acidiphila DSM 18658]